MSTVYGYLVNDRNLYIRALHTIEGPFLLFEKESNSSDDGIPLWDMQIGDAYEAAWKSVAEELEIPGFFPQRVYVTGTGVEKRCWCFLPNELPNEAKLKQLFRINYGGEKPYEAPKEYHLGRPHCIPVNLRDVDQIPEDVAAATRLTDTEAEEIARE